MSASLDPLIQQKLRAFAQRRRRLIIIKGVLAAVAALLLTMLVVAAVDLKWMLPDWLRWTLSGVAYAAVLVVVWRACLRQLLHAPDEAHRQQRADFHLAHVPRDIRLQQRAKLLRIKNLAGRPSEFHSRK